MRRLAGTSFSAAGTKGGDLDELELAERECFFLRSEPRPNLLLLREGASRSVGTSSC
jgi:hypothetical protein